MKCWATLAASLAFLMTANVADAASKDNPAFNAANKAWLVRYGVADGARNKHEDCAVQLLLKNGNGWEDEDKKRWKIEGTFYRYDNASETEGKYLRRPDSEAGKVEVSGWVSYVPKNSKTRRPVRFELTGNYDSDKKKVVIKGFVHTGKKKKSTNDDLLTIRYLLKDNDSGNQGNQNTGVQPQPTPVRGTVNSKVPCKQCNEEEGMPTFIDGQQLLPVALFQAPNDPCEEEPDTDVLTEESYDPASEDPDYDPTI